MAPLKAVQEWCGGGAAGARRDRFSGLALALALLAGGAAGAGQAEVRSASLSRELSAAERDAFTAAFSEVLAAIPCSVPTKSSGAPSWRGLDQAKLTPQGAWRSQRATFLRCPSRAGVGHTISLSFHPGAPPLGSSERVASGPGWTVIRQPLFEDENYALLAIGVLDEKTGLPPAPAGALAPPRAVTMQVRALPKGNDPLPFALALKHAAILAALGRAQELLARVPASVSPIAVPAVPLEPAEAERAAWQAALRDRGLMPGPLELCPKTPTGGFAPEVREAWLQTAPELDADMLDEWAARIAEESPMSGPIGGGYQPSGSEPCQIWLSHAALSKDGAQALVYLCWQSAPLEGDGMIYVLQREGMGFRVRYRMQLWVS